MDLAMSNYFDVLALADEVQDAESKITNKLSIKVSTTLPDTGKKQQQQRADAKNKRETKPKAAMMRAKNIVGHNRFMMRETEIGRSKEKKNFDAMRNQQTVVERKTLSLKEYEKELLEKKKVLNAVIKKSDDQHEEKKCGPDKDFEWMTVIDKKKKDDVGCFIKPKSDKEKAAGKAKVHKTVVVDVSGFLKPLRSERSFSANGHGKFTGRFSGPDVAAMTEHRGTMNGDLSTLSIEDHSQFPALK